MAPFVFVGKCYFFAFTILSECTRMLRLFVKITKNLVGEDAPRPPYRGLECKRSAPPQINSTSRHWSQVSLFNLNYILLIWAT
jgi:hypothetical protein